MVALAFVFLVVGFTIGRENTNGSYAVYIESTPEPAEMLETYKTAEEKAADALEADGTVININTAEKDELMELPGIGETLAQRIIDYREENGAFSHPADIMGVKGIGEGIYNKISEFIATGDMP